MIKRAHKNSNKCIRKRLRHILAICIKRYLVSYCPNLIIVSSETPFIKKSYHTETIQLIYKARPLIGFDTSFYRRVFQNKLE